MTRPERLSDWLSPVAAIAAEAGRLTLEYYGRALPVEVKSDNSPLTQADRASHDLIAARLAQLAPEIPVVSEEDSDAAATMRGSGRWQWLVDPLDGTKEFIKQTGQFTVNIGLVYDGYPVLGVVHVPVTGVDYRGVMWSEETGAWVVRDGVQQSIRTRKADLDCLTVVASRDHAGPVVESFLARLSNATVTSMGSSLKFCLVAEGKADFYPRIVPTMQWDTAAAQAVLEAAGGHLTDVRGQRHVYRKEQLRNDSVLAYGDRTVDWPAIFGEVNQ